MMRCASCGKTECFHLRNNPKASPALIEAIKMQQASPNLRPEPALSEADAASFNKYDTTKFPSLQENQNEHVPNPIANPRI